MYLPMYVSIESVYWLDVLFLNDMLSLYNDGIANKCYLHNGVSQKTKGYVVIVSEFRNGKVHLS